MKELGVTAIWMLPFYPSPRRDDGYDIADYTGVHPDYGTVDDFRRFVTAAHERGLKVITELVINHTSDQHPWFQAARQRRPVAPNVSSTSGRITTTNTQARASFPRYGKQQLDLGQRRRRIFWHRFYSHQPDLNFDNPAVMEEVFKVMRFWLDIGSMACASTPCRT